MTEPTRRVPASSYEPPALIWEEPYAPVALAVSCAHFPGQSASCDAAPCPPGASLEPKPDGPDARKLS